MRRVVSSDPKKNSHNFADNGLFESDGSGRGESILFLLKPNQIGVELTKEYIGQSPLGGKGAGIICPTMPTLNLLSFDLKIE